MKLKQLRHVTFGLLLLVTPLQRCLAEDPSGLWHWTVPGQNGGIDRIQNLRLNVRGSEVSATIYSPNRTNDTFTETVIRDATIDGNTLRFSIARQQRRATNGVAETAGGAPAAGQGQQGGGNRVAAATQYQGTIAADTIEGTIVSPGRGGKSVTNVWKALRKKDEILVSGPRVVIKPGYNEAGHKIINTTAYKELPPAEIAKYLEAHPDSVIVDTRSAEEFGEGHLPKSQNHDLTDEATYRSVLGKLDKNRRYVVVSNSGGYRTIRALDYFQEHGFPQVVVLKGGVAAWSAAGLGVEK